jgi:hypothetical protein
MRQHASLTALRALTMSARHLQLVCATIVGPEQMAVSVAAARSLGDPIPDSMAAQLATLDKERPQ